MQTFSVRYMFHQKFNVPAREAFEWCTNYEPGDLALMGEMGTRRIRRLTKDTIILYEELTHNGKRIKKVKLVRLNPRNLSWVNTHFRGPNKYSQFLYEITPEGNHSSILTFTGLMILHSRNRLRNQELRRIAEKERRYDSEGWKRLAQAMAKDHRKQSGSRH